MKTTLAIILTLLTLTSCSVQKRMYSPGYNFTWNTNKHNNPKYSTTIINNNQMEEKAHYDSLVIDDYVASTETKIVVDKTEKISLITVNKVKLNTVKNVVARLDALLKKPTELSPTEIKIIKRKNIVSLVMGSVSLTLIIIGFISGLITNDFSGVLVLVGFILIYWAFIGLVKSRKVYKKVKANNELAAIKKTSRLSYVLNMISFLICFTIALTGTIFFIIAVISWLNGGGLSNFSFI